MERKYEKTMASVDEFKKAVVRIRDIFRKNGITGMDSMRHASLYLLSRFLTIQICEDLKINKEFAWENIMRLVDESNLTKVPLELFKKLLPVFDKLFNTQKFSFDILCADSHTEILEILNKINLEDVDLHMDILGYVYEDHLKNGSSNARDLGQFFTDRTVCEYMVKLCNPVYKRYSIPESVCDPSMGTGGFLTAYMKHYGDSVDWNKQQKRVYGFDHDNKVAGFARLNVFIESAGVPFENLHCDDSLKHGLRNSYDIILANMPFGLKGLKFADCHESVKKLKLDGTKSEPLFLQLMMSSLNENGRCAVVVPEGMLENVSKCHNSTRKYLVDNFNLKRVIGINGKIFKNTSIKTYILFFEKSGSTTDIEFFEIEKLNDGSIKEEFVIKINKESFDETYSLNVNRYKKRPTKVYSDNIQYTTIQDVFDIEKGSLQSTKNINGEYTFITASDEYKTHKTFTHDCEAVLFVGGSEGSLAKAHHHSGKFIASDLTFILTTNPKYKDKISYKYIYYYLNFERKKNASDKLLATGTTKKAISKERVGTIDLLLPTLNVQKQIADQLDELYDLIKRLNETITSLKCVMKSLIGTLDRYLGNAKEICELFDVMSGKGNYVQDEEGYPYYDSNGITGRRKDFLYDGEHIVTARKMSIGSVHYVKGKFWPSDNTINLKIKTDIVNIKLVYYWLLVNNEVLTNLSSGIKPGIRKTDVEKIKVPIPPIEFQEQLIIRLDALQSQVSALEETVKNSEDNAKFILNSYLGV